jgi:hypothetical protein
MCGDISRKRGLEKQRKMKRDEMVGCVIPARGTKRLEEKNKDFTLL